MLRQLRFELEKVHCTSKVNVMSVLEEDNSKRMRPIHTFCRARRLQARYKSLHAHFKLGVCWIGYDLLKIQKNETEHDKKT